MASRGIRDRVAIVGMGCTRFGEHWNRGGQRLAGRGRTGCMLVSSSRERADRRLLDGHAD